MAVAGGLVRWPCLGDCFNASSASETQNKLPYHTTIYIDIVVVGHSNPILGGVARQFSYVSQDAAAGAASPSHSSCKKAALEY